MFIYVCRIFWKLILFTLDRSIIYLLQSLIIIFKWVRKLRCENKKKYKKNLLNYVVFVCSFTFIYKTWRKDAAYKFRVKQKAMAAEINFFSPANSIYCYYGTWMFHQSQVSCVRIRCDNTYKKKKKRIWGKKRDKKSPFQFE